MSLATLIRPSATELRGVPTPFDLRSGDSSNETRLGSDVETMLLRLTAAVRRADACARRYEERGQRLRARLERRGGARQRRAIVREALAAALAGTSAPTGRATAVTEQIAAAEALRDQAEAATEPQFVQEASALERERVNPPTLAPEPVRFSPRVTERSAVVSIPVDVRGRIGAYTERSALV